MVAMFAAVIAIILLGASFCVASEPDVGLLEWVSLPNSEALSFRPLSEGSENVALENEPNTVITSLDSSSFFYPAASAPGAKPHVEWAHDARVHGSILVSLARQDGKKLGHSSSGSLLALRMHLPPSWEIFPGSDGLNDNSTVSCAVHLANSPTQYWPFDTAAFNTAEIVDVTSYAGSLIPGASPGTTVGSTIDISFSNSPEVLVASRITVLCYGLQGRPSTSLSVTDPSLSSSVQLSLQMEANVIPFSKLPFVADPATFARVPAFISIDVTASSSSDKNWDPDRIIPAEFRSNLREVIPASIDPEAPSTLFQPTQKLAPLLLLTSSISFSDVRDSFAPGVLGSRFSLLPVGEWRCSFEGGTRLVPCSRGCGQRSSRQCRSLVRPHPVSNVEFDQGDETTISLTLDSCAFASVSQPAPARCAASISSASVSATVQNGLVIDYRSNDFFGMGLTAHVRGFLDSFAVDDLRACSLDAAGIEPACKRGKHLELFLPPDQVLFKGRFIFRHSPKSWAQNVNVTVTFSTTASSEAAAFKVSSFIDVNVSPLPAPLKRRIDFVPDYASSDEANRLTGSLSFQIFGGAIPPQMLSISDINAAPEAVRVCLPPGATFVDQSSTQAHVAKSVLFAGLDDTFFLPAQEDTFLAANVTAAPDMLQDSGLILTCVDVTLPGDATLDNGSPANGVAVTIHGVRVDVDPSSVSDVAIPFFFTAGGMVAAVSVQARLVFSFEGYHSTFTGYNLLIVLRGAVPSVVDQERVVSQLRPDAKGETHVIGETVAIERRDATTITIAFPVPKALSWALPLFARPSPNPSPFYDSQVVLKEQGSDELIASFSALETDWYPSGIWLCSSSQSPELDVCGDDPVPTCPAPQVNVFCGTGAGMSLAPTPLVCAFAPKAKQQGDLCGERFAFASLDHFSSASFALSIVINPEMSPIFSTAADANYILQIEIPSALRLLVHDNDQCSASMNSGGDLPCTIVAQAAISLVSVLLTPALLPNGNVLALNSTISLSLESLSYDEWVELSVGIVGSAPSAGEAGKPRSVLLSSPRLPLGAVNYVSSPEQSLGRADVVMSVSLGSFGGPDSVSFTATAVANQTSSGSGFNVPADEHGDSFVYDQLGVLVSTQFVLASKKADRALSCSISYTDNAAFDDIGFSSPNPVWPFVEQSTTFFGNDISQVVLRGSLSLLHMNLSTSMQLNEISMLAVSCRGIPAVYSPSSSPSSDRIALLFIDSARQQAFRQNVGRLPWIPTSDSAPRARARDRLPLASSSIVLVPFVSDGADYPDHILKSATETLSTAIGSSLPGADAIFIVKSSGQQQTLSAFSTAFRFPPEFAGIASIIAFGHKLSASLVAAVRSALTDAGFLAASSITPALRAPYYAPREGGWMCFSDPLRTRLEPCLPSSPCDPAFQGEMVCAFPIAPAGSFRHVPNELPNTECSFAEPPSPPNISDTTCSSALSSIDAVFTLTGNGNITNGTEAQGTLFVSFTLNDTLSSALDFALHFSDTDYIFDFVSADCTNLEVGLTMMNSSHIECSVPPQGGITVKLFGVTESGSFEIASVLLNSWSRSAILGITVNRLEDDSTLYFGDPEIKVGPVGVSVFAAAHTVSHFLPTKAESSRLSGEFLVGIDNDELQLVDFMPMELHILPPPEFTVEQCRVAFRLSSSPVAWPLLLPFSSSIYPTRLPSDDRVVSLSFSHSNGTLLEEGETLKGNSSGNLNITALWIVCEANVPKQYYVASKESLQTSFSVASQTMIADIIDPVKVSVLGGDVDLMTVPQPLEGFASFQIYAPRVPVRLADRIEKALHVNTRVTDLTNDTYQVNFELPSSQIVLAPAILLPALLMPALQNIPNERALTDASLIPLSQQWGYTGRWMCGSGPFENCYVPNNCGISFQKPLVCSVPLLSSLHSGGTWEPPSDGFRNYDGGNLGSVVSNLGENGIQYVTDPSLAACTFQNRPAEIISSGCGQYYCRNPHGARVPCTSAEVCFKGCSSKSQTIGAGDLEDPVFKPFCSLPDQPNSDVDPAAFCPQELVDPARYNRACIPRSECMYVCGNKSGFAVSCDSDESWKQCSVSCGNGVQERIKICTVPPAPALGSRVTSLTDTMCSFSRFSDSTVRPCGGSQCSDYQWYCSSDNGASYAPCDANGHLSGPWGPCSTDCGTGSRTRRVACAAIDSKGMVTDVGLPDSLCTPRSGKPASTSTCSVNVCANAKWMCYPDGGDPTKPVSCDSLGGFNCPTSGCGVTVRNRSIGCYSGTASIPTSICRSLTPPPTQTQCPAVTNSCTVSYRNSMCIYNATGERDASLEAPCVPASGPEPDIYMRGTCINLVGEKVSDSWCGSVEDILERCYLPPCSDDLRFEWRTEPGECRNVADMCATYRLVAVTCHATSPGIANITVSSALCDPTTRPPSAEACFPETDGIPTCANNGTCLNEPVRIDGVLYPLVVTGTCVCVPGTGGPLCEEKLAVSNLAVSFRGSTDWRFRWSVSSTVIAAPAVVSVRSPSLPDDVVIGIVDSRKQELLVPITTLSLLLSPGSYTLHVSVPFGETSTMLDLTPLCLRPGLSCLNNGLCNQSSGTCTCRGEYTGPTCASTPCDMKGCNPAASTCAINSGGVARCECATSPLTGHALFKGDRCQTPVGGCDPSLEKCLNGGERTGYISPSGVGVCGACSCPNFFSGELCERCTLDDSCVNGIPDSFCQSCQCKAGFMGPTCTCRFATLTFLLSAAEESDLHWYAEAATDSQTVLKTSPYYPTVLRWMSGIDSALSFVINDPDVSSSVFEHRLLRGSSGDLYVQVVARISGACGANLGAVLSFSLLDVEPEMYRVYAALARLLSALDSPDLSSSIPPLGAFVKNAGIGFNDPNCVRSERCPKNVGDGGTIHNVPGPVDPATREPPRSGLSRDETIALSVVLSFAFVAVLSGLFYTWYSRSCCFANRSEFDDFVEEDPRDTYGSV